MSVRNLTIKTGCTIGTTGGTDLVFADNGITIPNGIQLVVPADVDYRTRRTLTLKYRPAIIDPRTGKYSKDKKSGVYTVPVVLADGSIVFNTYRFEREMHPVMTVADCWAMNNVGAQLAIDSDMDGFWLNGSTM